ncbi:MAG: hypothetical protein U9Q22_02580, partial [Candidatus Altiarchaeota archaeon]|nr:hypothetical protein [Candidatus Altiarchaeota archaeon]
MSTENTWITFNNPEFMGKPTKSVLFDSRPVKNLLESLGKQENLNLRRLFLRHSLPTLILDAGSEGKIKQPDLEEALKFVSRYRLIPSIKSTRSKCSYLKTIKAIYEPIDTYLNRTLDLDLEEVIQKCVEKKLMKQDSVLKQIHPGSSEIEFYELNQDLDTIWTKPESGRTEGIFLEM